MSLALTIEKMKDICSEYGFVCDNGSIYYRQNNVANYWMNNDMKSCTVFFSAIDAYDNVYILFTTSMEILTIIFKQYDTVRNDVAALMKDIPSTPVAPTIKPDIKEEEEMTQEQFNIMMNNWIAE